MEKVHNILVENEKHIFVEDSYFFVNNANTTTNFGTIHYLKDGENSLYSMNRYSTLHISPSIYYLFTKFCSC